MLEAVYRFVNCVVYLFSMKKALAIIFAVLIIFTVAVLFVDVPYNIRAKGIVKPVKEWGLYKTFDGTLLNIVEDHKRGILNEYKVLEFQRGDIVSFQFNNDLLQHEMVGQGDTIAWVFSSDLSLSILEKRGAIAYQESLLRVLQSGERPEAINIARDQIELARQELETQRKISQRISHLFDQQLVSQQEYELAMNDLHVREHQLEIANSALEAVLAGQKEEEIQSIEARIASLHTEKHHLYKHAGNMHITAPFNGQLIRQRDPEGIDADVVIRIADTSSLIVFVPVDISEKQFIQVGQPVTIKGVYANVEYHGEVIGMDNSVRIFNRQPRIFISVMIDNENSAMPLMPNMIVDAWIHSDPVSLKSYLLRKSRIIYTN